MARDQRETECEQLRGEKESLSASVNELLARRKSSVAEIPREAFQTYNSMRSAKSNRPVSVLKDNACTICGIEQNYIVIAAIKRDNDLVRCQNCDRLLISM